MALGLLGGLDLGDQLFGQMLAMIEVRRGELRQLAHVFERHQPQLTEQHAEHRLVLHVIVDDETSAVVIDARGVHRALRAQPREHFLGEGAIIAKRGDREAHAPRHEMADRKLHGRRLSSLKRGAGASCPSRP